MRQLLEGKKKGKNKESNSRGFPDGGDSLFLYPAEKSFCIRRKRVFVPGENCFLCPAEKGLYVIEKFVYDRS